MTTLTLERATDEQQKQLGRVASDAADKAVKDYFKGTTVSKEGAQRVHANADFAARIREATILALADLSVTDLSVCGYLSGYKPRTIAKRELPDGAEGYFAIPRWQKIAPTYGEAVQKVLDLLEKAYGGKFYNYRKGQLGPQNLRQSQKSVAFWEKIGEEQKNFDILLVPAQFGIRHRGRSVRRAREVMRQAECGLGAFAVGIMLLTHMNRLRNVNDLWIDCAGDEFHDPRFSAPPFDRAPTFFFSDDGRLEFGASCRGDANYRSGSASGWSVPQK